MKKGLTLLFILALSFSAVLTACGTISAPSNQANSGEAGSNETADKSAKDNGTSGDETITLSMWDPFTEPETAIILDTIIENFQKENPHIKIKRTVMKNDSLRDTIKPALTSGQGPDLFMYDAGPGYLGVLAKAGLALDLTSYASKYGWNERFPEWINERVTFDGKMYGIGNEIELIGVYYNKKIFEQLGVEVPKTYEEFLAICEKAKANNIIPIAFEDKDQWPAFHLESVFYTAVAGKEKLEAVLAKKEGFDQPIFAEALDTFASLIKNGYTTPNPLSISYDDGNKDFFSGKAAMRITGTWMVAEMVANLQEDVGFFLLPPVKPELPIMAPGGIGSAVVISAKTKYPEETVQFLDYMFSEESAKIWYENSKIPPVPIDVGGLNINTLAKEVVAMANTPAGLSYNLDVIMPQKVNDVTKNVLQELIAGKKTGAEVVKAKQQALEEEIAKGNF